MTIVKGKIESLKRIKTQLNQKGIEQFNSLGSIKYFLRNYESEKKNIYNYTASELNIELENRDKLISLHPHYKNIIEKLTRF